jgi:hypothetical protein
MPTEQEVRRWVREEREQIRLEEQAACHHPAATIVPDMTVTCDLCRKTLTRADWDKDSGATSIADAKARIPM